MGNDEDDEDYPGNGLSQVSSPAAVRSSDTIDPSVNAHLNISQEGQPQSAQQDASLHTIANGEPEHLFQTSQPTTEALTTNDLPEIDTASGEPRDSASVATTANVSNDTEHEHTVLDNTPGTAPHAADLWSDHAHADVEVQYSLAQIITPADMRPDHTVLRLIEEAGQSAGKLVNLLAKHFNCFRDETRFDGRTVRIMKRAQIFVADLWAALNDTEHGHFDDIDHLTMFAGKLY